LHESSDKRVVQEQIRLRENALAQSALLIEYKQLFVHHSSHRQVSSTRNNHDERGLFSIFVSLMTEPLAKSGVARTGEDHLTIELVLHLLRNLLSAGDGCFAGANGEKSLLDSSALHLEMIQLLDRELFLDILLVIGQEIENRENKQYNLLLMEILHHLLKIQVSKSRVYHCCCDSC
jgi:timeless